MKISANWLAVCGAATVWCAGEAHAQSATLEATLNGSDPQASIKQFFNSTPSCSEQGTAEIKHYEVRQINVSTTGAYTFMDSGPGNTTDGMYAIYSGAFNPADITEGCVLSIDDGGAFVPNGSDVTLLQGVTYNMMFTTLGANTSSEVVGVTYTGPGTINEGAAAAPPVPTLSEWAMMLFGTILAGGAALRIRRRRQVV